MGLSCGIYISIITRYAPVCVVIVGNVTNLVMFKGLEKMMIRKTRKKENTVTVTIYIYALVVTVHKYSRPAFSNITSAFWEVNVLNFK